MTGGCSDAGARHVQLAGSSHVAAEAVFEQLATERAQTIDVRGVIQRLEDPRPLLRTLRTVLQLNSQNRVLVSMFDPSLPRAKDDEVPSPEEASIRLWTREQAKELFVACGFEVVNERSRSAEDPLDGIAGDYAFVLACSGEHYRRHLAWLRLPPPSLEYLLFSTEHSACKVTGGIGAYAEQMEKLLPPDRFALCYVGDPDVVPADAAADRRWILPSLFLDREEWKGLPLPTLVLRQLEVLTFLYPDLRTVEFQEYLGPGHLAGAAKRAGLLPAALSVKTRCHGSQIYLEACFSRWASFDQLELAYQEKVAIEQADVVSFPTRFLLEMYRSRGYRIPDAKVEIRKYPFNPPHPAPRLDYAPIDTLIFFGKRTRMKGFPIFVEALSSLFQHPGHRGIKRVIVIGKTDPSLDLENRRLEELKAHVEVIEFEGPRAEVLALIQRHAASSLCTTPYQSDNHPMAVLEAIATGCTILAANAGGIPEMIPEDFHRLFLHDLSARGLHDGCVRILQLPLEERASSTKACLAAVIEAYRAVSAAHLEDGAPVPLPTPGKRSRSTVGVIVPCFNSKLEHIRDLVYGLNAQSRPPEEMCFVDDGSRAGFATELEEFLSRHLVAPFRVVRHPANRGLASARNTGLRSLGTDYVVNIDSDDIPKADFLGDYVHYLDRDPEAVAVTSWLECFRDGTNWLDAAACTLIYRPLGDGMLLAQTQNCLGHANSAFRREYLSSIGGWDDADKSMWEDWALFLRIVSSGDRIGVVPKSSILYRVNDASMLRTYAAFPAMNRLARNVTGLTSFEAFRLQGLMRSYEDLRKNHEDLRQTLEQTREALGSLSVRIARRGSEIANRHPRFMAPVKKLLFLAEAALNRASRSSNGQ